MYFSYVIIFNKCTSCNLFTSDKTTVCPSKYIFSDTFQILLVWHHVLILCLFFIYHSLIYDATLNSVILCDHNFMSRSNSIYMCILIDTYHLYCSHLQLIWMTIFSLITFLQRKKVFFLFGEEKHMIFVRVTSYYTSSQGKFNSAHYHCWFFPCGSFWFTPINVHIYWLNDYNFIFFTM